MGLPDAPGHGPRSPRFRYNSRRRRWIVRRLALGIVLVLGLGCAPVTVTSECRQRIDDCIRSCPASQSKAVPAGQPGLPDTRSECERRCHQACYP